MSQKFCNHSVPCCHRSSAITQSQVVAEILQPLKHCMSQKFCDHSVTSCRTNSATTQPLDVEKILRSLSHKLLQKFCDPSVTSCPRNSATTQPLDVVEILQSLCHKLSHDFCDHSTTGCCKNSAITQSQVVAEILQPLSHRLSQKFCGHSTTECRRNSAITQSQVKFCNLTTHKSLCRNPSTCVLKQRYYACVTTLYVTLHKELSPISESNGVKEKTQDWLVLKAAYLSLRNFLVDGISLLSSVSSNELHTIQLLGRISTHGLDFCRGTCWGVHFPQ